MLHKGMDWIHLTWNRDKFQALVNILLNIHVELPDQLSNY